VTTDSGRVKSKIDTTGGGATRPTGRHSVNQQADSTRDETITKGTAVLVREHLYHCATKGKRQTDRLPEEQVMTDVVTSHDGHCRCQNIAHVIASCRLSAKWSCCPITISQLHLDVRNMKIKRLDRVPGRTCEAH